MFSSPGTSLVPAHTEALEKARLCCSSLSRLPFSALLAGTPVELELGPSSPVFDFGRGKSFFAAFRLEDGRPKTFEVETFPVNMLLNRYGHAFIPSIAFYDSQYRLLSAESPVMAYRKVPLERERGFARLAIPEAAVFIVVYSNAVPGYLTLKDPDQPGGHLFINPGPTGVIRVVASGA